jgi:cytochrome c biogenesis protein
MNKIIDKIWTTVISVRLSILLFILLIITAMIGTFIPQIPQKEQAIAFSEHLDPVIQKIYIRLELFDLFHSVWFRLIMGLLALNLLACSLDRFPKSWKRVRTRPKAVRLQIFEELPVENSFLVRHSRDEAKKILLEGLKKHFKKIIHQESEQGLFIHAEKGRWSYLGVYAVHLSIILILLGALLGSILGFEGFVTLEPGAVSNSIMLRKSDLPLGLGFGVRCDKFVIEFYEDGTPKEYRSEISFMVDHKVMKQKILQVNHPAGFRGVTFYQSSFGTYVGEKALLRISQSGTTREEIVEAEPDKLLPLPGGVQFKVLEINEDFMHMGPAAQIALQPEGKPEMQFWVFQDLDKVAQIKQNHPGMLDPLFGPAEAQAYRFILEKRYYTALQANHDPGLPLVWTGFLVLILGLLVTFYYSHRQIRVRLAEKDGQTVLSFTAKSNKNHIGMENDLKQFMRQVRDKLA